MAFPYRKVHMVGIGGAGMSAIAEVLLAEGVQVSGSDLEGSSYTERLQRKGAKVFIGHAAHQVGDAEAVIVSSAIAADNPELVAARQRGLPTLHRTDALALLLHGKTSIAVAGTHGKSTTTAMIGHILACLGYDPTVLVGAEVINFEGNCRIGHSDWMVVEADESDGSFLKLSPTHIVVTNIELDHPDHYADEDAVTAAFAAFAARLSAEGLLVVNADCPRARRLPFTVSRPVWWVGFGVRNEADYTAYAVAPCPDGTWRFRVRRRPRELGEVRLRVPGEHNVANALAALCTCLELTQTPFFVVADALAQFRGVRRRFETIGRVRGITIVSDYAHHPTEVQALLQTARQVFCGGRLWVVFQPHRYSRTQRLWQAFGDALANADGVWVTDIFAAAEPLTEGVTGELIAHAVRARTPQTYVKFAPNCDDIVAEVVRFARPNDAVLLVGAGDIYKIAPKLMTALSNAAGRCAEGDEGPGC
ncbi:UDP-N-acetylmuramate--L-alanine ligase [bacterium HR17]|uniref:UDP-N-acetylmuramate--L-alanine ligase n=1 Tax=Candidatus Fervidibacter japonicus TaxID=2035412 RepID=A0A2H5XD31_9BACT|nr:UDP-N-acetylmuramate--L-alanine ligase [bacterium HR17]